MRGLDRMDMFFRYMSYWRTCFGISFKQAVEYKSNLFSAIFLHVVFTVVEVFVSFLFAEIIGAELGWGVIEFLLFAFFMNMVSDISGFFWYGRLSRLDVLIKSGDLNSYLTKPGKLFWLFLFKDRYNPIIFIVFDLVLFVFFFGFFADFLWVNVLVGVFGVFLLVVFNVLFVYFLMSFSWVFVELGDFLMLFFWRTIQGEISKYPFQFFSGNSILFLVFSLIPFFYVSRVLVPIVAFGDFSGFFGVDWVLVFGFVLFLVCSIVGLWMYGLKNYEAFG